jgi:branched-chain amino acid transport system permease protein
MSYLTNIADRYSNRWVISGSHIFSLLAATVLAAVAPFAPSYLLTVLTLFCINVISIVGYRVITLMGGWSFAHVSLMGVGAYTMALLTTRTGWPVWPTLVLGPLVAAAVAAVLAYPILRTRHYYFFLSSAAAAEAIRQCFLQFTSVTGGAFGLPFIQKPEPLGSISFSVGLNFFYLVLVLLLATGLMVYFFIDRAPLGQNIRAVALNEQLSESLGMNTFGYRALAFVVGSAIAGLAGVLFASFNGIVSPSDFSPVIMFKVVAAAIVGGAVTFWGPILGLALLTLLEEVFRAYPDIVPLLWGISVIITIRLLPGGLETLAARLHTPRSRTR